MTNEEAIERLETHTQYYVPVDDLYALEMAISALREQEERVGEVSKTSGWISVNDRLPKPFVSVLVYMPQELPCPTVREGFITSEGVWHSALYDRDPDEVTYWCPMPSPPTEEEV